MRVASVTVSVFASLELESESELRPERQLGARTGFGLFFVLASLTGQDPAQQLTNPQLVPELQPEAEGETEEAVCGV